MSKLFKRFDIANRRQTDRAGHSCDTVGLMAKSVAPVSPWTLDTEFITHLRLDSRIAE